MASPWRQQSGRSATRPGRSRPGPTFGDAATSAALAVARVWHASSAVPKSVAKGTSGDFLTGYRIEDLGLPPDCLVTRSTRLDWVQSQSLADGRQTVVPRDLVCLSRPPRRPWRPAFLTATAVGLGAGATRDEAIVRGLCDWAAHDASAVLAHGAIMGVLDIRTIPDAWCARTVQQLADAGGQAVITALPSRTGMPCWAAIFRGGDAITVGIAARPDPVGALAAALCDAARGPPGSTRENRRTCEPRAPRVTGWDERPLPWRDLVSGAGRAPATVAAVTRLVCAATGAAPLVVDLTADEGIAVVKVLCPDPARLS